MDQDFVDKVEEEGTPRACEKSHLVRQDFNDKPNILTRAPTAQIPSQRLFLSLAARKPKFLILLGDVKQAYTQSKNTLERPIFIRPPVALNYPKNILFKVVQPLY